tara:strand:+ start:1468 stop:1872 length:405 start_codon:yes stop_codon:yes gene_type:complete
MDFGFKEILFGIAGVSMIAWVAVIGLWHTFMFPRFFQEDGQQSTGSSANSSAPAMASSGSNFSEVAKGAVRPLTNSIGLTDRNKYSRQSIVLADFNPVEAGYSVNRLYTIMLLSLGVMSFIIITFGLQSGFALI